MVENLLHDIYDDLRVVQYRARECLSSGNDLETNLRIEQGTCCEEIESKTTHKVTNLIH